MRPQTRGLFHKISASEAKVVRLHHVTIRTSVHVHGVLGERDHLPLHHIVSRLQLQGNGRWGKCSAAVIHKHPPHAPRLICVIQLK